MHITSHNGFARKRLFIPTPKLSENPFESHLQFDYYCIHGNKKPLELYRRAKQSKAPLRKLNYLIKSIEENIKSYPKLKCKT